MDCTDTKSDPALAKSQWRPDPNIMARSLAEWLAGVGVISAIFGWVLITQPHPVVKLISMGGLYFAFLRTRVFLAHWRRYRTATYLITPTAFQVISANGAVLAEALRSPPTTLSIVQVRSYLNIEWRTQVQSSKGAVIQYAEGFLYLKPSAIIALLLREMLHGVNVVEKSRRGI